MITMDKWNEMARVVKQLKKMDEEKTKWHMKTIKEMNRINDLNSKLQRVVACAEELKVQTPTPLSPILHARLSGQYFLIDKNSYTNLQQAIKDSK